MPLVYQQNINAVTKMGVWHIAEAEDFFLQKVSLQNNITHWHKRLQHLAGRYLLKELYADFPLELIKIADTRKPFLEDEAYHFSISHCGNYVAVVVSKEYRVGVDVELVTPKIDTIIHKFLSAQEQSLLSKENTSKTATLFWSVKESVYKWKGSGGVDFIQHIHIQSVEEKQDEGIVHCVFEKSIALHIHYLCFNNNYLTWVLSLP